MTINHKILLSYIKDLSIETPDPESLLTARENFSKYSLKVNITPKALKRTIVEVDTKLTYSYDGKSKKSYFEMIYATVVDIKEQNIDKESLKKFLLCDLQILIYPKVETTFVEILKLSGFPNVKLQGKIDFKKLYNQKLS